MALRLKRFLRRFHHYKKWHLPISFAVLVATIYGTDRFLTDTAEILLWAWNFLYFGIWGVFYIARQVYNPIPKEARRRHVLDAFLQLPDYLGQLGATDADVQYRISRAMGRELPNGRLAPNANVLDPFVSLSDEALGDAHPDLGTDARRDLYERWWSRNSDCFLTLERRDGALAWRPVAVSIILPLTESGRDALEEGIASVLKLRRDDITERGAPTNSLLIDTFIIHRSERRLSGRYPYALLLKHLSLFWDPTAQPDMSIILEPDVRSVRKLARICRFHGPVPTADGGELWSFNFSHDRADSRLMGMYGRIAENMMECRTWPLEVGLEPTSSAALEVQIP